jgi:septum formation protein
MNVRNLRQRPLTSLQRGIGVSRYHGQRSSSSSSISAAKVKAPAQHQQVFLSSSSSASAVASSATNRKAPVHDQHASMEPGSAGRSAAAAPAPAGAARPASWPRCSALLPPRLPAHRGIRRGALPPADAGTELQRGQRRTGGPLCGQRPARPDAGQPAGVMQGSVRESGRRLLPHRPLILGSTSRYRHELLSRLHIGSRWRPRSTRRRARRIAGRLACRLAWPRPEVAARFPPAVRRDRFRPGGRPGGRAAGQARHTRAGHRAAAAHAGPNGDLPDGGGGGLRAKAASRRPSWRPCEVVFRDLDDNEIEAYLQAEQPYDCAGSAKSEGLGIALLERIDNDDPTALVGLPLIRTCALLRAAGVRLL